MEHQKKIFFGILLVMSMDLIDITVLNSILPTIAASLNINAIDAKLTITSYSISLGIFIPLSVWVANRFGVRAPMMITLAGFILSSVCCGFCNSLYLLVFFRVLQGFFGALLLPISQTTMIRMSTSMLKVSATISMYMTASAAIGQLIGAFFAEYLSWRLVFFINVPIGLIGFYFIKRYLKDPFEKKNVSLDWVGLIIIGGSVGILFILSNIIAIQDISNLTKILMFLVPVLASIIYFLFIKKIKNPILNFGLFKHTGYSVVSFIIFMNKLSLYWLFFAFPIYLYLFIDFPITEVALVMATIALSTFSIKRFSVFCVMKLGMKITTITSSFLILTIMVAWGYILQDRSHLNIILVLIPLFGMVTGIYQTATSAYKLQVVPDKDKGDSNVQGKALLMIASAFSISFLGLVYDLSRVYLIKMAHLPLFILSFEYCFIVSGVLQFLASLLVLFMKDNIRVT
jgi:MFS family permease